MPEFEEGQLPEPLTNKEIFQLIWTEPVRVFTVLRHYHINQWTYGLIALASMASVLNNFMNKHYGDKYNSFFYFIGMAGVFVFFSFFVVILYASMIAWTGKWLKGRAGMVAVTRVFAYAQLPLASLLLFQIPCILLYGIDIFKSNPILNNSATLGQVVSGIWITLSAIMSIWSFILSLIGLAELQNFSLGKSFLNYMIPVIIIFLIVGIPLGLMLWSVLKVN